MVSALASFLLRTVYPFLYSFPRAWRVLYVCDNIPAACKRDQACIGEANTEGAVTGAATKRAGPKGAELWA